MTGRNRAFATAGALHLGKGFDAVVKLLPPERREAIERHLETPRTLDQLRAARQKEQRRIEKVARCTDAEPRLKRWMIDKLVASHGRT